VSYSASTYRAAAARVRSGWRYSIAGVGFAACLATGTISVPSANAQIQEVVVRGDAAPAGLGSYLGLARPIATDAVDRVVFEGKVAPPGSRARGVFVGDPLAVSDTTVALQRDFVASGAQIRRFTKVAGNSSGVIFYQADVSGQEEGIYSNFSGGPTPDNVALRLDPAPAPATGTLDRLSNPVAGSHPGVVFYATIGGAPVLPGQVTPDEAIIECTGGDLNCSNGSGTYSVLVLKGDSIPDRPGRRVCDLVAETGASSWGIVFRAETDDANCVTGAGVLDPAQGVFRLQAGGMIETIALEGEQAEPIPASATYDVFRSKAVIEDDGIVAFVAGTDGVPSETVVYRCNPSVCPAAPAEAFVQEADTDGVNTFFSRFEALGINNTADVVFFGRARNAATNKAVRAIWVKRNSGAFEKVAEKGDTTPSGDMFRRLFLPSMSPGGTIVWRSRIRPIGGGGSIGIYLYE